MFVLDLFQVVAEIRIILGNVCGADEDEVDKNEILSLVNVTEKALQLRDEDAQWLTRSTAKSGAEYFASRSYHGLDINSSDSLPGRFLAGRSGKASGYEDEKADSSFE